jgi:hypothetical protein
MRRRLGAALAAPAGWGAGGLDTLRSDFGLGGGLAIAGFAGLAVIVGALAGIAPALAIGLSVGLVFALLAFTNLGGAFVVFTFLAFLEFALPSGAAVGISKGAGLVLAMARLARSRRPGTRGMFDGPPGSPTCCSPSSAGASAPPGRRAPATPQAVCVTCSTSPCWRSLHGDPLPRVRDRLLRRFTAGTAFTGLRPDPHADDRLAEAAPPARSATRTARAILVAGIVISIALAVTARDSPSFASPRAPGALACSASCSPGRAAVIALAHRPHTILVARSAGDRWRSSASRSRSARSSSSPPCPRVHSRLISQTFPARFEQRPHDHLWSTAYVRGQPRSMRRARQLPEGLDQFVLELGTLARNDQIIDSPKVAHNAYLRPSPSWGSWACCSLAILALLSLRPRRPEFRVQRPRGGFSRGRSSSPLRGSPAMSPRSSAAAWLLLAMGPVCCRDPRKAVSSARGSGGSPDASPRNRS